MIFDEIRAQIRGGESASTEFIRFADDTAAVAAAVCGFLNSRGGIVFSVSIRQATSSELVLTSRNIDATLKHSCRPPLRPQHCSRQASTPKTGCRSSRSRCPRVATSLTSLLVKCSCGAASGPSLPIRKPFAISSKAALLRPIDGSGGLQWRFPRTNSFAPTLPRWPPRRRNLGGSHSTMSTICGACFATWRLPHRTASPMPATCCSPNGRRRDIRKRAFAL